MKNVFIILPNQLFDKKYLKNCEDNDFYIIEDPLYFGDKKRVENFNKLKLVLHRASMKYYFDYLKKEKLDVQYLEYKKVNYNFLKKYNNVNIFDTADHLFNERLNKEIKKNKQTLNIIDTPMFLLTLSDLDEYQKSKKNAKTYFHKHFYDWQLKKLEIPYIEKSYDELNREKIPDNVKIPNLTTKNDNDSKYVKEAKTYVDKVFKDNYGEVDNFIFPITHKTAKKWISIFLKKRIYNFGTYQDAILKENDFMFHSLLSSSLNIGLITPQEVVDKTIKYYEKNKKEVKINNFEGFIRQVVGWREYQRMLYQLNYDDLIKSNYFNNNKSLNKKWYTGELDILPIDTTIKRAFKNGYLHHIERLMVMLNFMVLARIKPDHVYRWFMEFACDSYDWVMVGNVYGMGYFNTNTMRKPYISTSNYIRNMSDYKDDGKWNLIWDALFYKFLTDNKSKLKGGAAVYLRNLVHFEKKTSKEKKEIFARIKL